jgi:hypothetical protein
VVAICIPHYDGKLQARADRHMSRLSLFGLVAVTAMVVAYAFENRSHWFVLAFGLACALGSVYGFLQGAWPFGLVEAVWSVIALRRWMGARKTAATAGSGAA